MDGLNRGLWQSAGGPSRALGGAALGLALMAAACGTANGKTKESESASVPHISIATAAVVRQPITRSLRVTGSLLADEQAEVSAETAGRVVSTPVERGTRVGQGDVLIALSREETESQVREAEANAAQIQARLALDASGTFDVERVPDVANAQAALALAESEYARIKKLLDERVVSQSEYDQRRTQVEAARLQYESAKNSARQLVESLESARARVAMARKSLADTVVRAPFAGLVAERRVSIGDYVTRGTQVVTVVRIHPLRLELTVPEQFISQIRTGAPVALTVDAYPGQIFKGQVRFVSPSLHADQRALTVEAIVPNPDGTLKPGFFVTAEIQQPESEPALLVPKSAIHTVTGTSRVFVVHADRVEERVVNTGQTSGDLIEIIKGVAADEVVAASNVQQLSDGLQVTVEGRGSITSSGKR